MWSITSAELTNQKYAFDRVLQENHKIVLNIHINKHNNYVLIGESVRGVEYPCGKVTNVCLY